MSIACSVSQLMRTTFTDFADFTRTSRKTVSVLAEVRGGLSMTIKAAIALRKQSCVRQ